MSAMLIYVLQVGYFKLLLIKSIFTGMAASLVYFTVQMRVNWLQYIV